MSKVIENLSVLPYNTFQVAAKARYFVELNNAGEVSDFVLSRYSGIRPRFVLGGGSNVLFTKDFDGIILHPAIRGMEVVHEDGETVRIRVGAGENWDRFVEYCVSRGWGGVENLSLIPGSVGASPVQNIGAYGAEVGDVIDSVEIVALDDGRKLALHGNDCGFSYRNSIFKNEWINKVIITHVTFRLFKYPRYTTAYPDLEKELARYPEFNLRTIREAVISIRREKLPDPAVTGNAGSFFKNPVITRDQAESIRKSIPDLRGFDNPDGSVKVPAAWLIERCGWKGRRTGNTGTHHRQPLILVNHGGAAGEEIYECALKIRNDVMSRFGIQLEMEVNIL